MLAINLSASVSLSNIFKKHSQLGSLSPLKCGVTRYSKCRSFSITRLSDLAFTRSVKIYCDSSGAIELANAALPSGVGNIKPFSMIKKNFDFK